MGEYNNLKPHVLFHEPRGAKQLYNDVVLRRLGGNPAANGWFL
jgi:hypothetical protein